MQQKCSLQTLKESTQRSQDCARVEIEADQCSVKEVKTSKMQHLINKWYYVITAMPVEIQREIRSTYFTVHCYVIFSCLK
jgi:hypothetical protein